jgi:hypothetical protein
MQKYMFDKMYGMQQPYNAVGLQGLEMLTGNRPTLPGAVRSGMGGALSSLGGLPGMVGRASGLSGGQTMGHQGIFNRGDPSFPATPGGIDPTGGSGKYLNQLEGMGGLNLPGLNLDKFSFQFDPNDPTYKFRQQEMEKTINQAAAARGNWNSRPTINALAYGNMGLTADESEKQFTRGLAGYGANTQTALAQYGADTGRAKDLYGSQYGKLTDLYNMSQQLGGLDYQKVLDQVKIGQGAAGTAGQGALATGQGLSQTYGNLGNQLANNAMTQGQVQSDMWSGMGQMPMNYLLMQQLMG